MDTKGEPMKEQQEEKLRCPDAISCKADCMHKRKHKRNEECNRGNSYACGSVGCIPVEPEPNEKFAKCKTCQWEAEVCCCYESECDGTSHYEPKHEGEQWVKIETKGYKNEMCADMEGRTCVGFDYDPMRGGKCKVYKKKLEYVDGERDLIHSLRCDDCLIYKGSPVPPAKQPEQEKCGNPNCKDGKQFVDFEGDVTEYTCPDCKGTGFKNKGVDR